VAYLNLEETYNFCPRCGSRRITLSEDKRIDCRDCALSLYFNPTCSAAALIFDKADRLLVVERSREPSKGCFGVPGGFSDHGERLEEVLARETKEETNLDIESARFLASFPNRYAYRGIAYSVVDVYFLARVCSFEEMKAEESEVQSIQFVDPRRIPPEKWAFDSLRHATSLWLQTQT